MMQIPETLCKDVVLKYITELEIFEYYLGHKVELQELYYSPFRVEKTPSFNIYVNKNNNRLWYKDYGSHSGDCFRLVQHLHHNCSFIEALEIVDKDFNLGIKSGTPTKKRIKKTPKYKNPDRNIIEIKIRPVTSVDMNYWSKQLSIKESKVSNVLKYFKIFPTEVIWINKFLVNTWRYKADNPIYSYYMRGRFKCYRPLELDKSNKWRSNLKETDWLGYNQLPKKGDLLVISKSYKDVTFLRKLGIYAIAINGESHSFPSSLISELKSRFTRIVIWFDNDEVGIQNAKFKAEEYDLEYVYIPEGEPKDPTDYNVEYGLKAAEELIYELGLI